jgi:hypothetical protein
MVNEMTRPSQVEVRLRQAASLPEVLAAGFEAFEAIRMTARDRQNRVPELFAAFMMTADAAVDGREALTIAPSLPLEGATGPSLAVPADADAGLAADVLAALATALGERLTTAASQAGVPTDRAACQDAAEAARRICQLMTR